MGICLDKLPHSCGTKDGLQVFADDKENKVNGYCFACHTFIANPYGKEKSLDDVDLPIPKTEEEIQLEIAEVSTFGLWDLPSRKLSKKYLEEFGIKIALSEEDGETPYATYFPIYKNNDLKGYYIKTISKPSFQWSIGDVKGGEPFGWQQAKTSGAYRLIITEGREDAVAITSIFDRHGDPEYKPAVIALPNGTNSVKNSLSQIAHEASRLFKEIIITFDDDKSGDKATEHAMAIFPKAKTVKLPAKDANDCILEGCQTKAYKALAYKALTPKNTRLITANKRLHVEARTPTPYGELTWPFSTMNKLTRQIRCGETIYIGSGVKMGKSELLNELTAHFIKEDGVKVMVCKPEEDIKETYKRIAGKISSRIFTDPDIEFDYDAYDKAGEVLEEQLIMVDIYQHVGWDTLKQDIVAAAGLGVKAVFIDPITNLTNGINAADANTKLQDIAQDLSAMAKDLDIVVFIFVHLKANDGHITRDHRAKKYEKGEYVRLGNCAHEYGGDMYSSQFAGSRAMMRSCNLMLGLEGNKDDDLPPHVRELRWITFLEDRQFNNSGSVQLHFNPKIGRYKEA